MRLPPLPTIGDVIRLYRLSAAKKLSQNFIMDMKLNEKIVKLAGNIDGCYVCEVGPGPGGITRAILNKNVRHLYVIEKDKRFFPGLQMLADVSGRLTAYHGDVLRFEMDKLFPEDCVKPWTDVCPNIHIIGNLPFSVSTPLLFNYMKSISEKSDAWRYGRVKMTLTFQKEVAERIVAQPGNHQRCRVSVVVQNYCDAYIKTIIPGKAFVPAPDVDVGLVKLIPRRQPIIDLPFTIVTKVARHLFHHRQKMCKNNLKTLFPENRPELLDELFQKSNIERDKRPMFFTMDDLSEVCHVYADICRRLPYIQQYDYRGGKQHLETINEIQQLEIKMGYR